MNFFSLFKRNLLYKFKKKINVDQDGINYESLDKLFHYYGSDKANIFKKNNEKGHGFSKFYLNELDYLKPKKIKILEIGSFAGASAVAFSKYFKEAEIFCFDINISKIIYSSKRIKVYGLDINNEKKLLKTLHNINSFDIIIDDGSHNLSDILIGLKILFKFLNKGGHYIIEDYKHPEYYAYNRNINHILVDELLDNLIEKKIISSEILDEESQLYLQDNIKQIKKYKGNLVDSDICFIKKN